MQGKAGLGMAWQGTRMAGLGRAWQGKEHGMDRQG